MKKRLLLFSLFFLLLFAFSCQKNEIIKEEISCDGGNFCFNLNGSNLTIPLARWRFITPNQIRIEWQDLSGTKYQQVVVDVYGSSTGIFTIQAFGSAQTGSKFQYFTTDSLISKTIRGTKGSVEITVFDSESISGKFSMQAQDILSGENYTISEGRFQGVPKQ